MRADRRWVNQSQPQTLQIAVFFFYADAVLGALFGSLFSGIGLVYIVAAAAAGYGIANELKWGYGLGLVLSVLAVIPLVLLLATDGIGELFRVEVMLSAIFPVARLALLLHPMSRDYQRIWFK
jgi:hypothetical protein